MKRTKKFLAGALALTGIVTLLFFAACGGGDKTPTKYSITKGDSDGGSFTISPTSAVAGTKITLTVSPDEDNIFNSFLFVPDSITAVDEGNGVWSFTMPASKVTVSALFDSLPPGSYAITKGTTEGKGSYNISATVAVPGTTITLTAIPDAEWVFVSFTTTPAVDVLGDGLERTFLMPSSNVAVNALFVEDNSPRYAITKGTVTPADTGDFSITGPADSSRVLPGTTVTLTPIPASAGYEFDEFSSTPSVTFGGTGSTRTFQMPEADITINVTYKLRSFAVTKGTVTPAGSGDFTIDPASPVEFGATVTLKATENAGFRFVSFTPATLTLTKVDDTTYTFEMPASAVTVSATFGQILSITKGTVTGGDLTFSTAEGAQGQTITITLVPDTLFVEVWDISPPDIIPVAGTDPGTFTFIMPAVPVIVGAELTATNTVPGVILEKWDFTDGLEWHEHYDATFDCTYWKWRDAYAGDYPDPTNYPRTIYGTFTDSLGESKRGTSVTPYGTANGNSFGSRYHTGQGALTYQIKNPRLLDLTGFTHISIWVKVSAPTNATGQLGFLLDNGRQTGGVWDHTQERRFAQDFAVGVADVWTEVFLPITAFMETGAAVNPTVIGGWMFRHGTFMGQIWVGQIMARNMP